MSTQVVRKYWERNEESNLVTPAMFITDDGRVTMFIHRFVWLVLEYGGNCEGNTIGYDNGIKELSEEEFMRNINKLENEYGIKISIRGTNASQSSDT